MNIRKTPAGTVLTPTEKSKMPVGTLLSYLAVSFLQNQLLHLIFGNMDVAFENVMPASFFVPSLCMELVLGAVYLALTHFILDRHLNLE